VAEHGPSEVYGTDFASVDVVYDVGVDGDGKLDTTALTKGDAVFLWPHKGWNENVRLRLWPITGDPFDVFLSADRLRAALDQIAPESSSPDREGAE
jgi:hypothetical protein